MSYQIITYSPDTGTDERGDYRTQREAQQALKQYLQEAGALIYDLDRWRIAYRRGYWPAWALPIERMIILETAKNLDRPAGENV